MCAPSCNTNGLLFTKQGYNMSGAILKKLRFYNSKLSERR
jgi:hypothetical protein